MNPDNDSVAVIDVATRSRLAEIAVGDAPRTIAFSGTGQAWIVNRDAASVSVVDPATLRVDRTLRLPAASQPYGIVFSPADRSAWITLSATGEVVRLDPSSGAITARIAAGADIRHLAITASGDRLLVSRFISAPLPDEATARPKGVVDGVVHGGEVVVIDAALGSVAGKVVLAVSDRADTALAARGIPNYLGAAAIAPDGHSAWIPSKQDNVMRGQWRDGLPLDFQTTVRGVSSRIVLGSTPVEDHGLRVDHDNSGVASAATFDPTGRFLFVALETSRAIAVIDPDGGREARRFAAGLAPPRAATITGFAPQGLAVSADGKRLAVNNVMSRAVGLFDLSHLVDIDSGEIPEPTMVATVTTEKLAAVVLRGKQLFYDALDPRLARDAYLSCASCHNDGGGDGRIWDITQFGEGLRNTIPLAGRSGASLALHWSANFDEVQDFEGQIRSLAGGTGLMDDAQFNDGTRSSPLGQPKIGLSADLDALAAYVESLGRHEPSPYRNADRSLTPAAVEGKALFAAGGCATCHGGAQFAGDGSVRHDVGTMTPATRPLAAVAGSGVAPLDGIDTPTLRDVWASAPYLHDGSAATLGEAIARHTTVVAPEELASLAEYVRQIGNEE